MEIIFNISNISSMIASNISIGEFMKILSDLNMEGFNLMDLELLQDERYSNRNKLIIHPVKGGYSGQSSNVNNSNMITNPVISKDNNDIFDSFNDYM